MAYFEFACENTTQVSEGTYRISVSFAKDAKDLFGMETFHWHDVVFHVKDCDREVSRSIEDLIERHYLWGGWLYKFDRQASKKEFEKAWKLVQDYLRQPTRGHDPGSVLRSEDGLVLRAGDEPGLWNITPRYQAYRIARNLDYHKKAVTYLMELLSKDATERTHGRDCKLRFYHFDRERGHLPHNMKDDLGIRLNRMYEQVYGKTMQGVPVKRLPLRKHFADKATQPQAQP